jgi:hypothetical protein
VTSTGRTRQQSRARRGQPISQLDGVLVDSQRVPVVLMIDDDHMWRPEDYGYAHGYNLVRERYTGLGSWRAGPEGYGLTTEEWQTLTIIVPVPLLLLSEDSYSWERFVARLKALTGREPENTHLSSELIFT